MNILILRITLNPCPDNGIWGEIKQNKGAEMKAFEFITDKIGLADRMGYSDCLSEKEVVRVEKYSYQAPMGYGELTTGYCLKVVLEAGFQKEFWLKLSTDGQKVVDNMDRMPQGAVLVSSWDAEGNPVGQQVKTEEPSNKVEIAFDYPSKEDMMTERQYEYLSDLALQGKVEGFPFYGSTYSRMRKISKSLASDIISTVKYGKVVKLIQEEVNL